MSFTGKWNGIIFMLSKLTQTQKVKSSLFSFTCGIQTQTKAMKVGLSEKRKGATYWKGGQETTGDRGKKMQGKYQCDRGILHTCQKLHNESHYFVQLMHTN